MLSMQKVKQQSIGAVVISAIVAIAKLLGWL